MFRVNFDISPLLAVAQGLDDGSKAAMKQAGERLLKQVRAHMVEEANKKLHSRRQLFIDGIHESQLSDDTWVVNLDASVRWIDDGMQAHSMVDDLLQPRDMSLPENKGKPPKKIKTAKDGSKYTAVPFKHNGGNTQMTPAAQTLRDTLKAELKKRDISYQKLESGANGQPKLGLLHKFDIKTKPIKTANTPGQGKGPVGQVMQGPTGIPLLQAVRIYQRQVKNKDGSTSVRRDIMTFRMVSSKHKNQNRWEHPGLAGVKIMDETFEWAKKTWEQDIVPQISLSLSKSF